MATLKSTFFSFLLLSVTLVCAQEKEKASSDSSSINSQFQDVIENSNNYQDYKVVKQVRLEELQKNTVEEINELNNEIEKTNATIQKQEKELQQLEDNLLETQATLEKANQEKEEINFLGFATNKNTYQTIMWLFVIVLGLILIFFIYKYKSSNAQTKEARKRLEESEADYDDFRQKSLEKQQKLGRMLQDEKNKQAKNGNQP